MKLRIRGDSLRLRLSRGEVRQLRETGSVVEVIHFGVGTEALAYEIRSADDIGERPVAEFDGRRVTVSIPRARADAWADSDEVGITASQPLPQLEPLGQRHLALLIEKDFQCLAPRDAEEDLDAFPNPAADSGASC